MQDVFYIEEMEQAISLLKPIRIEILRQMDEPSTCPILADYFDESPQKIYYHVKALEKAGLVEKVSEKRVRGVVEGYYQARARSYWLAPHLVGKVGEKKLSRDQQNLQVLLHLAEEVHDDLGKLANQAEAGKDVPSLSLSAHIHLPDADRRAEFLEELALAFQSLARKYGTPPLDATLENAEGYRLVLACYPQSTQKDSD
jgi:DNA-binding transcriptional ArsR family regulator